MMPRQSERRPCSKTIQYAVTVLDLKDLKRLNLQADCVDISDVGLGITTSFPLEPGHVLTFTNDVGRKAGLVKWSVRSVNSGYRVGIKFV